VSPGYLLREQKLASKVKKQGKKSKKTALNHALVEAVFVLSRQMRSSFSARLKALDLYSGQERIILLLAKADGKTPSDIAESLGVSAPTIAKSINRLSARGFVVRKQDVIDRRRANVYLTELGVSLVSNIRNEQKKWRKELLKSLSKPEKQVMLENLQTILSKTEKND
jgi:DNA-binding MarR family transcriptional regulator